MLSFSNPPLLCMSALLFLLQHSPALSEGSWGGNQCHQAPFVPGHNLIGFGFNAVTLKRASYVIDVTTYRKQDGSCNLSLINYYSNEGSNDWQYGLDYFSHDRDYVGTKSHVYKFATDRTREDQYTFSSHRVTCSHYSYRLSDNPKISEEFYKALDSLPYSYNSYTKDHYWRLIDSFGTHYTRQVYLGGQLNRVAAARTCLSSLNGLSSQQVHYCMRLGFSVGLGYSSSDQMKYCNNFLHNQHSSNAYQYGHLNLYTKVIGGRDWSGECSLYHEDSYGYKNWLKSLKDYPDVVKYSLRPLHELVPHSQRRNALRSAIQYYLKEYAVNSWTHAGFGGLNHNQKCCPHNAYSGHLEVTITKGWVLKRTNKPRVYAVVKYKNNAHRTHEIRSNDPVWNGKFDLGQVDTHQSFTVQVWANDKKRDSLLVSCDFNVYQGKHTKGCSSEKGKVDFHYALTCGHHLNGDQCHQYKPSPYYTGY
ncbi:perforin-1-like [Clinocottus analis]|uniref:perforin-1-like n=1 Tax=Clinocottus analis TaxID=304258 RepID=UPI0035C0E81C